MNLTELEVYLKNLNVKGIRKITHVQTHHTWSPSYRNFNGHNHFDKLTSMEADHIARGFGQIAQHFTTFPDGTIATGRPLELVPTCIHGHNTGGICIENLGNFDAGGDTMDPRHKETIIKLNALLLVKFGLPVNTDTLVYHHWFRQSDGFRDDASGLINTTDHKSCPGTAFFGGNTIAAAKANFLPAIQQAVDLYNGKPATPVITGKPGTVNADLLNVRKGPGANFDVVEQLKRHATITVLETKDDWDRIGDNRWVKADYVALT